MLDRIRRGKDAVNVNCTLRFVLWLLWNQTAIHRTCNVLTRMQHQNATSALCWHDWRCRTDILCPICNGFSPLTVLLHWYEWGLPSPVQHGEGHGFRDLLPVNPPASVAHQERLLHQVISTWFFCTLLLLSTFPHNIFFYFFLLGTSKKFSRLKRRRGVLIVESHIQTFFI